MASTNKMIMTMKNADKSAMPNQALGTDGLPTHEAEFGLTKREMMAMHIFIGMISNNSYVGDVKLAVELADALIVELDRTSK